MTFQDEVAPLKAYKIDEKEGLEYEDSRLHWLNGLPFRKHLIEHVVRVRVIEASLDPSDILYGKERERDEGLARAVPDPPLPVGKEPLEGSNVILCSYGADGDGRLEPHHPVWVSGV